MPFFNQNMCPKQKLTIEPTPIQRWILTVEDDGLSGNLGG